MSIGYEYHIFVCENKGETSSCGHHGTAELRGYLKDLIREHGLKARCRANKSGCLNYCSRGPVLVIYPENSWYHFETKADLEEIVLSHIRDGKPIPRLLLS
jgi:(2Fe-2S) ferredoxin